jgi:methyl-accepting chemotaxis protein
MNLLKNISIGRKFTLTFGFLFLIVLLLGISWQRGIDSLKEIEWKRNNLIELKERLREMQLIHHRWVDTLRESVRKKGEFEGELDPQKCVFGQWYYSYQLPYPELKTLFDALGEPHKNLHEAGGEVRRALEQGNISEAEKLSLHIRQVLLPELMTVYDSFMKGIGNVYEKYKLESERSVQRQKFFSKTVLVISLFSVFFLAFLMTRAIVRPLKKVTDTALKISEGEMPEISQKEIPAETQNEIVQMENAFTKMALSVNELSKTAEQIASGDLSATVNIRSEKDVLGNAIAKMVENLKMSLEDLHTNSMNLALGMSDYFTVISEFSLGNLDIKASEDTGDDLLNQLGKVTNNMIAEYKKLSECMEEVRKGNLDVEVHVRSEKDTLGIGFEHMLEHLGKTSEELHTNSMNLAMGLTDYFFVLQQVASGDLTVRANEETGDDLLSQLGRATNSMISSLKDLTLKIREQADFLAGSANAMATVSKQLSKALSELSSAILLMSSATSTVAENSQGATSAAQVANESTRKGSDLMTKLADKTSLLQSSSDRSVEAMKGLSLRSSEIGNIVSVMTKIAFQTNLLSLNAAIEAARAGESGHGFAVVADEVRKLAESSANSAREISKIVKEVQEETEQAVLSTQQSKKEMETGVALIEDVRQQFISIASQVENIFRQIESIASSAAETASSAAEASASSEEQTAAIEELAASATELSSTAEILKETMARFKV